MNKHTHEMIQRLTTAGISFDDAWTLRRIAMTLHRWNELECGDSNERASWCITRGNKHRDVGGKAVFTHDDDGKPFLEHHPYDGMVSYTAIPDRERGAIRRLESLLKRYPTLGYYLQGDPRGAALYILRPGDVRDGQSADSCYNNGIAVYK